MLPFSFSTCQNPKDGRNIHKKQRIFPVIVHTAICPFPVQRSLLYKKSSSPTRRAAGTNESQKNESHNSLTRFFKILFCTVCQAAMGGNISLVNLYSEKIEPYLTDPLPYARTQVGTCTHRLYIYEVLFFLSF